MREKSRNEFWFFLKRGNERKKEHYLFRGMKYFCRVILEQDVNLSGK